MTGTTPSTAERLSRPELVTSWTEIHGSPPPKGISTRLLHLACEYNRQVREYGGLKKNKLRELLSYSKSLKETKRSISQRALSTKPLAGTRLIREWRGQSHVVDVLEKSVLYQGKTYRSLSHVACAITGTRWSGPRFFGLSSP